MSIQTNEILDFFGKVLGIGEKILSFMSTTDNENIGNEDEEGSRFRDWWKIKKNRIYITPLILCFIFSIFIILIKIFNFEYLNENLQKIIYGYEVFFLLIIALLILRQSDRDIESIDNRVIERALGAEKLLFRFWFALCCSWFLFYLLCVFKQFGNSTIANDPALFSLKDFFNNLSGLLFFCMYYESIEDTQGKKQNIYKPVIIGSMIILILLVAEISILRPLCSEGKLPTRVLLITSLIYGIAISICTVLFVARLQSEVFNVPKYILIILMFYGVIQVAYFFLDPDYSLPIEADSLNMATPYIKMKVNEYNQIKTDISLVIFTIALYGKAYLFMIMRWLFDTDRILYYAVRHQRIYVEEFKNPIRYKNVFNEIIRKHPRKKDD